MTQDNLRLRLNDVFCEVFNDDTIKIYDGMTSKDIEQWDSLKHIALIVAIEKEFNFQFNVVEIGNLENVGQLMSIIQERSKL